jgi:DNA-binding NarL/FixJ family response regulator
MEAVKMARALTPKVVLMDWAMPKMSGLLATRRTLEAQPEIAILILSMHSEAILLRQAIEAGVRGFILKNAAELDLASATTQVASGEFVLDPHFWRRGLAVLQSWERRPAVQSGVAARAASGHRSATSDVHKT